MAWTTYTPVWDSYFKAHCNTNAENGYSTTTTATTTASSDTWEIHYNDIYSNGESHLEMLKRLQQDIGIGFGTDFFESKLSKAKKSTKLFNKYCRKK